MGETTLLHSFGDDDDDDDDGEFTISVSIRFDLEYIKFVLDSWLIDDPFPRRKRPRDWFVKTIGKGKTANCTDRGWRIFSTAP